MPTFNRLDYLKPCFDTVNTTVLLNNTFAKFNIVDDASNDETKQFITQYNFTCFSEVNKDFLAVKSEGVCELNLLKWWAIDFDNNYDLFCVLDSDTIVNKEWLIKIQTLYNEQKQNYRYLIVSSFDTKNHKIISKHPGFVRKKSIGGINMLFDRKTFMDIVKPCLNVSPVSWDWQVVNKINQVSNSAMLVTTPSYINHLGKISVARDSTIYTFFDEATNFIEI